MKRKPTSDQAASHRSSKKGASPPHSINTQTHPDGAVIDVEAEKFVVAVPLGRCEELVRTYTTFTCGVHVLRDWLLEFDTMTATAHKLPRIVHGMIKSQQP